MNLNDGRKVVMQMEECFEKMKFSVFSETERIREVPNDSHIEFYTHIKLEDVDNIIFNARLFYNLNLIELSILLKLDFDDLKRLEIIHLLNQINFITGDGYWSLYDNEIDLTYATLINKRLPKKYFERMIRRTIFLGKSFYPLILKQIRCDESPYKLAYDFLEQSRTGNGLF